MVISEKDFLSKNFTKQLIESLDRHIIVFIEWYLLRGKAGILNVNKI